MNQEIMTEFGIPDPSNFQSEAEKSGNPAPAAETPENIDTSMESRLDELFGPKGTQPAPVAPVEPAVKPAEQPKPDTSVKPVAAEVDPAKLFAEASPKAFFSESGDLNTAKINDYYLTNGKSFMKYVENAPVVEPVQAEAAKPDPEKEYREEISAVTDNIEAIMVDQLNKGFTEAQTLQNLVDHIKGIKGKFQQRIDVKTAIEAETKRFAPQFEQAKKAEQLSMISRNVAELSSGLNDLIPGMNGMQVLNQFTLNPKYGGAEIDRLFLRDNPGALKLAPEEKDKVTKEWFMKFQANKSEMAHVAEFGRLRYLVDNFKPILEHAQQVGAAKVINKGEAEIGKPSNLVKFQKPQGQQSEVDKFFGVDSVN
jgi:hypothetical protein